MKPKSPLELVTFLTHVTSIKPALSAGARDVCKVICEALKMVSLKTSVRELTAAALIRVKCLWFGSDAR